MIQNFVKRLNNITGKKSIFKGVNNFFKFKVSAKNLFSKTNTAIIRIFPRKKNSSINAELFYLLEFQILQNQLFAAVLPFALQKFHLQNYLENFHCGDLFDRFS